MIACYLLDPITRNMPFCPSLPFMPYEPTPADQYTRMANQRWMEKVAKLNPQVKIRDMVIPATHDAGTYGISINNFFYFAAKTQRLDIYHQLVAGSRSLDLRYGSKGSCREDVYIFHGPYAGPQYKEVFEQINRFITENPNEFLVVLIQQENAINADQKDYLLELIRAYLTPKAITKSDSTTWFKIDKVTIGQIVQKHKNYFVLADSHLCLLSADQQSRDLADYEAMGIYESSIFYHSSWANTNTTAALWEYELKKIGEMKSIKNTLVCTQTMLTQQTTKQDIESYIIGTESLRLDHFTKMLKKDQNMANFFIDNIGTQSFNYIELDYIDYSPELVKYLIGLNFPHALTVISAKADDVDVTKKVAGLVSRGRVVYIPNFKQNLKLDFTPREFSIEFMYQGDSVTTTRKFATEDIGHEFVLTYMDISKSLKKR